MDNKGVKDHYAEAIKQKRILDMKYEVQRDKEATFTNQTILSEIKKQVQNQEKQKSKKQRIKPKTPSGRDL